MRFSIRSGMIAVAAVAATLGTTMFVLRYREMKRLSTAYSAKAASYAWYERENARILDDFESIRAGDPLPATYGEFLKIQPVLASKARENVPLNMVLGRLGGVSNEADYQVARTESVRQVRGFGEQIVPHKRRVVAHYAGLRRKYEQAALAPSKPVPKDGPEPQP